ncbi:MAG: polysaccharide biosynthesis tyrosine autokinase [Eubacteriales bacterium]|nr:polysaccharide biosynthesis tyrosine autokinase [Eubacteriales bacterium]
MQDKVNTKTNNISETVEIDFGRIWKAIWKKAWLVALASVLCAVTFIVGTKFLLTPEYESSTMLYVNNNSLSVGDTSFSIDQGDITASKSLVNTYIVILNSRECLTKVIDYAGVDLDYSQLKDMISAAAVNDTEIFEVTVTSTDPQEAEVIANAIAEVLPKCISNIVDGTSANVVDHAVVSTKPSSPSYTTNAIIGFLIGFILSVVIIALREVFDVTIRTSEEIERCCEHPILASVPDMLATQGSGGKYYGYGYGQKRSQKTDADNSKKINLVGKHISFMASEAYKLLRTKLQFSFVDEITCPIIGISSALTGEGKSLSSVNIAYSLAQLDKRVLLIDCDMRRPSLSYKLPISKVPGLSNYLTGHCDIDRVIQRCALDDENSFDVISSGDNPPNPIELLSSNKMEKVLNALKSSYDYIIMDLPPVGEVSDAMVAAKFVDGMLLIVRQDYCNTVALSSAISQFEFIETRILGIVMNCVGEIGGKYARYGKKGYYSKYSKYGKSSYESAYAKANKKAQDNNKT